MRKEQEIFTQVNAQNVPVSADILDILEQEVVSESVFREYIREMLNEASDSWKDIVNETIARFNGKIIDEVSDFIEVQFPEEQMAKFAERLLRRDLKHRMVNVTRDKNFLELQSGTSWQGRQPMHLRESLVTERGDADYKEQMVKDIRLNIQAANDEIESRHPAHAFPNSEHVEGSIGHVLDLISLKKKYGRSRSEHETQAILDKWRGRMGAGSGKGMAAWTLVLAGGGLITADVVFLGGTFTALGISGAGLNVIHEVMAGNAVDDDLKKYIQWDPVMLELMDDKLEDELEDEWIDLLFDHISKNPKDNLVTFISINDFAREKHPELAPKGETIRVKTNELREYIREMLIEQNVLAIGRCFPFTHEMALEWWKDHIDRTKPRGKGIHPDIDDKSKFKVVHGTVTNKWHDPPKAIVHAWVEMGDMIFDDQTKITKPDGIPRDVYYDMYQPEIRNEYTAEEAVKKCSQTGSPGPWDEESLGSMRQRDAWMNEATEYDSKFKTLMDASYDGIKEALFLADSLGIPPQDLPWDNNSITKYLHYTVGSTRSHPSLIDRELAKIGITSKEWVEMGRIEVEERERELGLRECIRTLIECAEEPAMQPIMDPLFNMREMCKEFTLLEDHLNQPDMQCHDCINKHLMKCEALAEEALSLDNQNQYPFIAKIPGVIRGWHQRVLDGESLEDLASSIRPVRKKLTPLVMDRFEA